MTCANILEFISKKDIAGFPAHKARDHVKWEKMAGLRKLYKGFSDTRGGGGVKLVAEISVTQHFFSASYKCTHIYRNNKHWYLLDIRIHIIDSHIYIYIIYVYVYVS